MAPRCITHVRETESRDYIRSRINSFYPNGDALVREWSERDYGIDFILELFKDGYPTGKIAFLQIKGTKQVINKLSRTDAVSCKGVSATSLNYALQRRIPYILLYVSTASPECCYFIDLQSIVSKKQNYSGKKSINVHLPIENCARSDLSGIFDLINTYYTGDT